MTTKQKDGGAAFPNSHPLKLASGMTLRHWYAGMALQGMCSNLEWVKEVRRHVGNDSEEGHAINAKSARHIADAMIAELADFPDK